MAAVALITGATGLLGRHVMSSWDVPGLAPRPVDRRTDDLLTPGAAADLVRRERPSVVVHLAWTASGTPGYRQHADNDRWVTASRELVAACAGTGAAFLGTGTAVDTAVEAADAYTVAKARLRRDLADDIDAGRCTWLRPFYVVDPIARRPELVAQALSARESGDQLVLRTPGSLHDFVHAADVGTAVVAAVRHRMTGEVPIGSGRLRAVSALVTALGAPWTAGTETARPAAQHHEAADTTGLRQHGWSPAHTKEMFNGE